MLSENLIKQVNKSIETIVELISLFNPTVLDEYL